MREMVNINNVYQMDCMELLNHIEDNSIDLIYCDILYNTGKTLKIIMIILVLHKKLLSGINQSLKK